MKTVDLYELGADSRALVYDEAAQIIRTRGINKDGLYHERDTEDFHKCKVCVYGAITVALGGAKTLKNDPGRGHASPAMGDLGETLYRRNGSRYGVTQYNDDPNTTVEDVATLLTETASRLRAA